MKTAMARSACTKLVRNTVPVDPAADAVDLAAVVATISLADLVAAKVSSVDRRVAKANSVDPRVDRDLVVRCPVGDRAKVDRVAASAGDPTKGKLPPLTA